MNNIIPIDFVAGAHGHFLEVILNIFFKITDSFDFFTDSGTSHNVNPRYLENRLFQAEHWFELYPEKIQSVSKLISIQFKQEDLLLLSSVSMLRAGDFNLSNNELEDNTFNKLNTKYYKSTLELILKSYPELTVDKKNPSIPRNVLREFYKFGFANPDINGYWLKQQEMHYSLDTDVFYFDFANFYNINKFVTALKELERFVDMEFKFNNSFYNLHSKFLSNITYTTNKDQCDQIIQAVIDQIDINVPKLTLFQESYINGQLENYYKKEMPFHNLNYFTSTKDMLQYIINDAPNL